MKSPTEIHSNSAIELQVYHLITCYHNFCIMSLLSRQQSFPLQVKRICRDSSFVTLMSFSAKLSLPARFFSHCFGSHGRTLNYFRDRLRTAKRYVTWLVSNHDRRITFLSPEPVVSWSRGRETRGSSHWSVTRRGGLTALILGKSRKSCHLRVLQPAWASRVNLSSPKIELKTVNLMITSLKTPKNSWRIFPWL